MWDRLSKSDLTYGSLYLVCIGIRERFFRQRANIGITRSCMRWYVRNFFPTASLHRDHSILYALVCEKEISHICKNNGNHDLVCEKKNRSLVFSGSRKIPTLGKPRFPLERWVHGLGFSCPSWTLLMISIDLTWDKTTEIPIWCARKRSQSI